MGYELVENGEFIAPRDVLQERLEADPFACDGAEMLNHFALGAPEGGVGVGLLEINKYLRSALG